MMSNNNTTQSDTISASQFVEEVERIRKGLCPFCAKDISEELFKDELSLKESKLSGLCQDCQDGIFSD